MPGKKELPDHSAFVLHLRTIHFLIVIVSATVLVVSLLSGNKSTDKVRKEHVELNKFIAGISNKDSRKREKYSYKLKKEVITYIYSLGDARLEFCLKHAEKLGFLNKTSDYLKGKFNGDLYASLASKPNLVYKVRFKHSTGVYCLDELKKYPANAIRLSSFTGVSLNVYSEKQTKNKNILPPAKSSTWVWTIEKSKKQGTIKTIKEIWNKTIPNYTLYKLDSIDLNNSLVVKNMVGSIYTKGHVISRKQSVKLSASINSDLIIAETNMSLRISKNTKLHETLGTTKPIDMFLLFDAYGLTQNKKDKPHAFEVLLVPAKVSTALSSGFQQYLFKRYNLDSSIIKLGKFSQSFPELAKLFQHREGKIFLSDIENEIRIFEGKQAEDLSADIFGLKIELESILKYGALIIISLMFYYWLIMRVLVYKLTEDNKAFGAPWIGIYPDSVSYTMTYFSTIFLPFVVSIIQAIKELDFSKIQDSYTAGIYSIVLVIVTLALTISFRKLNRISKQYSLTRSRPAISVRTR